MSTAHLESEAVISDDALNYGILSDPDDDQFIDLVEMGLSREVISDELYYPVHKARGWIRCYVTIMGSAAEGGMDYRMYLEGSQRFLLSAKQLDNDVILISSDEDFPLSGIDGRARIGYGATAIRQEDSTILVTTNHCHLCDNLLGRHTCGRGDNREIVARVVHSTLRHRQADAEMRIVNVQFPYISRASPEAMREGRRTWCPRTLLGTGPASMSLDTTVIERIKHHPNNVRCVNKLPVWNETEDSLMLHFQANRVLSTSVCNFLLYEERKLLSRKQQPQMQQPQPLPERRLSESVVGSGGMHQQPATTGGRGPGRVSQVQQEQQRRASIARGASGALMASPGKLMAAPPAVNSGDQIAIPADQALLQFGRVDNQKFILDFKYPLSPLQAFGISICSFAFEGIKKKKNKKKLTTDGSGVPPPPRSPLGRMLHRSDSITSLRSGYDSDASDSSVSSRVSAISTASRDSFSSQSSLVSNLSYLSTASRYSTTSSASSTGGHQQSTNGFVGGHQGQGQGLLSELPPHRPQHHVSGNNARDRDAASGESAGVGFREAPLGTAYIADCSSSDATALTQRALRVLNERDNADDQNEI